MKTNQVKPADKPNIKSQRAEKPKVDLSLSAIHPKYHLHKNLKQTGLLDAYNCNNVCLFLRHIAFYC